MSWLMNSFGREIDLQGCAALYLSSAMRLQLSRLVNYPHTQPHEYPIMFGMAAVELTEYSSMALAQQQVWTETLSSRISLYIFQYFISVGKKKLEEDGAKTSALINCFRRLSATCFVPWYLYLLNYFSMVMRGDNGERHLREDLHNGAFRGRFLYCL